MTVHLRGLKTQWKACQRLCLLKNQWPHGWLHINTQCGNLEKLCLHQLMSGLDFSLIVSKCDIFRPWIKEKICVFCFSGHSPAGRKVPITLPPCSPLLGLLALLNYLTILTRLLTAALAGVSIPDTLTSPDRKLAAAAASHQLIQPTSSTNMPFPWGSGGRYSGLKEKTLQEHSTPLTLPVNWSTVFHYNGTM